MLNPSFVFGAGIFATLSVLLQAPGAAILLSRLISGLNRPQPLQPKTSQVADLASVSVVVPTLNEAQRLQPCLDGLMRQGYEIREILIVDSQSQDGTPDLVRAAQCRDPRLRLVEDDPLPAGWVGRPWALNTGFRQSAPESTWILGLDADTLPQPGLVASLVQTARQDNLGMLSLSPRFVLKFPGEWWLQPALLMTLIYRFGAAKRVEPEPNRILANGQCLLIRRSLLEQMNGYDSAQASFCDDVTLVRHGATCGARVSFRDGSQVLKVRMYEGAQETWQEWGRSLDLKDATAPAQVWGDLWFLWAVQGLPVWGTLLFGWALILTPEPLPMVAIAFGLNAVLLGIRWLMTLAIAPVYDWPKGQGKEVFSGSLSGLFWLSPLADSLSVWRITLSSWQRPKQWRGRVYGRSPAA